MRLSNYIFAFLLGAGLLACSDAYEITVSSDQIEVNDAIATDPGIDSMIGPYREEMTEQMSDIISYADQDFTSGRPNGSLNNWSADVILHHETYSEKGDGFTDPVFCLLNVGGLRNPISKGDVTIGDIYKLMPFDNEVVWVEMPWSSLQDIADYLNAKGGEPIAGAQLKGDSLYIDNCNAAKETFWVITSDYLMNGGDKMTFFEQKITFRYAGVLMRDVMIEAARGQDVLFFDDSERIQL